MAIGGALVFVALVNEFAKQRDREPEQPPSARADTIRESPVPRFQRVQVCRPDGDVANTIIAGVTPNPDSLSLVAVGRSLAARYPTAAGVEVLFFSDSTRATCTFPMSDASLAAFIANYTVNRRRSGAPEFLNYQPGKRPHR